MSTRANRNGTGWAELVCSYGVSDATTARLVRSLVASEVAALAFCRLLDRWARGVPSRLPCRVARRHSGGPQSGSRRRWQGSSARRTLPPRARAGRGRGPFVVRRAGRGRGARLARHAPAGRCERVAAARCAGIPRAGRLRAGARRLVDGRPDACRAGSGSLWAGLFDLRENLFGGAVDDLRALAA